MKKTIYYGLFLLLILFPGCSEHYYKITGDQVEIYIKGPDTAETVIFFSSLDGFQPHTAEKTGNNNWRVSIAADREFSYFFSIDDEIILPKCDVCEYDDFGSKNCIFIPEL